jgi:hypothetical protein
MIVVPSCVTKNNTPEAISIGGDSGSAELVAQRCSRTENLLVKGR